MWKIKMAEEIFYKIKRRSDDLFSNGGSYPKFTKKGKIWRTLGHLRSHLNSVGILRGFQIYEDCEIVELVSNEHVLCSVRTELENAERREQERQRTILERHRLDVEQRAKEEQDAEIKKLKELLDKYPEFESILTTGKIIKRGV
jgi:hydroxyacyl-ACP dehydratase HTD2-like protein with hotdog domain